MKYICNMCLRTDGILRNIDVKLLFCHHEMFGYTKINESHLESTFYCPNCEYLLKQFHDFKTKCNLSWSILQAEDDIPTCDQTPIGELAQLLPSPSLGLANNNNHIVISLIESSDDSSSTNHDNSSIIKPLSTNPILLSTFTNGTDSHYKKHNATSKSKTISVNKNVSTDTDINNVRRSKRNLKNDSLKRYSDTPNVKLNNSANTKKSKSLSDVTPISQSKSKLSDKNGGIVANGVASYKIDEKQFLDKFNLLPVKVSVVKDARITESNIRKTFNIIEDMKTSFKGLTKGTNPSTDASKSNINNNQRLSDATLSKLNKGGSKQSKTKTKQNIVDYDELIIPSRSRIINTGIANIVINEDNNKPDQVKVNASEESVNDNKYNIRDTVNEDRACTEIDTDNESDLDTHNGILLNKNKDDSISISDMDTDTDLSCYETSDDENDFESDMEYKQNNDSDNKDDDTDSDTFSIKTNDSASKSIKRDETTEKYIDMMLHSISSRKRKQRKKFITRKEVKTDITKKFATWGNLKTADGTNVNKEFILKCIDDMLSDDQVKRLWRRSQNCTLETPSDLIIKYLTYIQNKYKTKYDSVFEIGYLNTRKKIIQEFLDRRKYPFYSRSKYKCRICFRVFMEKRRLEHHTKNYHDETAGKHVCKICFVRYKSRRNLYSHHFRSHETVYKCKKCIYVTYNKRSMITHYQDHKSNSERRNTTDRNTQEFYVHNKTLPKKQYMCFVCTETYTEQRYLQTHLRMHTKEEKLITSLARKCWMCNVSFVSEVVYQKHLVKCRLCRKPNFPTGVKKQL